MSLISREAATLLRKELRQIRRSRGALISSAALSLVLLVLVPLSQLLATSAAGSTTATPFPAGLPGGLTELDDPRELFSAVLFPMFVTIAGITVPAIAAVHTIVVERERRSLELLVALPVRVTDIIVAKLLATLALASLVLAPLLLVDLGVLIAIGVVSPGYAVMAVLLLAGALTCAIGISLLVALVARDFRSANNTNGLLIGPITLIAAAVLFLVPGEERLLVLAGVLLALGVAAVLIGLRWITFERYLA